MIHVRRSVIVPVLTLALVIVSCQKEDVAPTGPAEVSLQTSFSKFNSSTPYPVSVFSSGFNNPRGIKFGPDGYLYVAEGGLGGTFSTTGECDAVVSPIGPYTGGMTARISKVNHSGGRSTVAENLPSVRPVRAVAAL